MNHNVFKTWHSGLMGLLILSWVSCDSGNSESADLRPVMSEVPEEAESAVLSVITWQDYLIPELLREFSESSQAELKIIEVENSEQLQQYLESAPASYDVVIADELTLKRLISLRLLAELRRDDLPAFSNLSADFLGLGFDPENGYSAPYLWGLVTLAYRKDLVEVTDKSWNLLWDPRVKGRVGFLDEPIDLFLVSMLSEGGSPMSVSSGELDRAQARLLTSFRDMGGRMGNFVTGLERLASGELAVAMGYNGDSLLCAERNPEIEVFIPSEGAPFWVDSFAIVRDSPQQKTAHAFIDFMLSAQSAATSATRLRHGSPNRAALELIDTELLANPVLYPSREVLQRCREIRFPEHAESAVGRSINGLFEIIRREGIDPMAEAAGFAVEADAAEDGFGFDEMLAPQPLHSGK